MKSVFLLVLTLVLSSRVLPSSGNSLCSYLRDDHFTIEVVRFKPTEKVILLDGDVHNGSVLTWTLNTRHDIDGSIIEAREDTPATLKVRDNTPQGRPTNQTDRCQRSERALTNSDGTSLVFVCSMNKAVMMYSSTTRMLLHLGQSLADTDIWQLMRTDDQRARKVSWGTKAKDKPLFTEVFAGFIHNQNIYCFHRRNLIILRFDDPDDSVTNIDYLNTTLADFFACSPPTGLGWTLANPYFLFALVLVIVVCSLGLAWLFRKRGGKDRFLKTFNTSRSHQTLGASSSQEKTINSHKFSLHKSNSVTRWDNLISK